MKDALRYVRDGPWHRLVLRRSNPGSRVASTVLLQGDPRRVVLGSGSYVGHHTFITVTDEHEVQAASAVCTERLSSSRLLVGDNTFIGELNNIRASGGTIEIGDDCLIAQGVNLIASNHLYGQGRPSATVHGWSRSKTGILIGRGVWIAAGATILPGVTIGADSVVAAGAVVTKSVPDRSVVAGVPARRLLR